SSYSALSDWFRAQALAVPQGWLEAGEDWLCQEHGRRPEEFAPNELRSLLYEQYLHSDLREFENPSLPAQVASEEKLQLTGKLVLQLESVIDVSQSLYSQYRKCRGDENANLEVTSNETNGGNFGGGGGGGGDRGAGGNWDEPKGGRMLLLTLTDGCAQLRAVECRPMPQLSVGLPPGCKLRLLPPLLVRRGIAMLTSPQSVEVLGGQVDELVVERSQESLLLAALRRLGFEPTDSEQAGPRQPAAAAADAANRLFADLDTGNNRPATVGNQQQQHQQRNQPDAMATSRNQPDAMATYRNQPDAMATNWNQPDAMATYRNQPDAMATYRNQPNSMSTNRNQPDAMATNRNQSIPPASSSAANNRGASNIRSRPYPDTSAANRGNSLLAGGNNVRDLLGGFDPFEDDEDAAENSAQPRQRLQQQSSRQTASGMNPSSSGTSLQRQQSYQQQQPQPPRQMSVQEVLDADDLLFAEAIEGIDCDELEAAAVAPSAAASSANRAATSASADRQPLFPSTSTKRPRMELERRAAQPEGRDIAGIPTSKEPFVYLKDVYTWLEESGPQVREFTVRGYLMGLRGRLEIRDGGYSLPCLLADATCTISCNLGDRVLTDLLGFTAAEADAARRSGDSGTLARCQAALLEMQQQLANMAGLFLLAFDIRQETATAIRFRCVTHADVDALRRRVRARKAQERRGGRQQEAGLAAQDDEFLADWDDGLSG
ncbi:hypothetical protein BOX15_Mlig018899g1, partial [Macrostomum lignano]